MRPRWFKLLMHNNARHRFGLSFPYMVGALQDPPGRHLTEAEARRELGMLLVAMRDETPDTHLIRISECDRLRQPVAAPIHSAFRLPDQTGIRSPHSNRTSLFVAAEYLGGGDTVEAVADSIWRLNGEPLSEARYSYRAGQFELFGEADRRFAIEVFALPDEDSDF